MSENEIVHYGVKGMKWGVRNKPGEGVRQKVPRKVKRARKTGDFSKLSDKQLRDLTSRLAAEAQARGLLNQGSRQQSDARTLNSSLRSSRREARQKRRDTRRQKNLELRYQKKQKKVGSKKKGKIPGGKFAKEVVTGYGKKLVSKTISKASAKYVEPKLFQALNLEPKTPMSNVQQLQFDLELFKK